MLTVGIEFMTTENEYKMKYIQMFLNIIVEHGNIIHGDVLAGILDR